MSCRRAAVFFIIVLKRNLCFSYQSGKTDSVLTNANTIALGMVNPYKKDMERGMDVLIAGELGRCTCYVLPI